MCVARVCARGYAWPAGGMAEGACMVGVAACVAGEGGSMRGWSTVGKRECWNADLFIITLLDHLDVELVHSYRL